MGISQLEYDNLHGEGSFAELRIPGAADGVRPSHQFRETPSKRKPGEVDLGYWNFADLKGALRRTGESDDQFLSRMIATFKTPTLRHLRFTPPYMHNGAFGTLEDALAELIELSDMSRAGRVRSGDDELAKIRIRPDDIPSLVAFLNALNQDLTPKRRTSD
jgi:cytochrome c peroxidase